MTTEVIITGIGCPVPTTDAGPGVLVKYGDTHLQFDAGRATSLRLVEAGSSPMALTALFITHHHSDHVVGVQDIVLTRWVMDRAVKDDNLPIIAPEGPSSVFAERMLDVWADDIAVRLEHNGRDLPPEVDVIAFDYPETVTEVWRDKPGDVVVSAGQVRHEPVHPSVGYRVETPDGIVAITGDTLVCDEVAELADGADVLIYEAMRFSYFDDLGPERQFVKQYHASTLEIGKQAAALNVPTLILTHLIPQPSSDADRQGFVEDIRAGGFDGELIVAHDLSTVTLPQST